MPLLKPRLYTSDDYWNLPENTRAELIDGQLYNMAPPSRIHQRISGQLYITIGTYIEEHRGNCQIYAAPFAVNLDCEDKNWVEPDLSVICDPDKLTDRGCSGYHRDRIPQQPEDGLCSKTRPVLKFRRP